jgi:hypothetical protein
MPGKFTVRLKLIVMLRAIGRRTTAFTIVATATVIAGLGNLNLARGEWHGTNCFDNKLKCVRDCSKENGVSRQSDCVTNCEAKSSLCITMAQDQLKREQTKKRCLSLPDDKKYFGGIVRLAWRQTEATLQSELLALRYFQSRIQQASWSGATEASKSRELAEEIANLGKATEDFSRRLDALPSRDGLGAADQIYGEISKGSSAFEALSDAAAHVVAGALTTAPERESLLAEVRAVRESGEMLKRLSEQGGDLPAAKDDLKERVASLETRISELQKNVARVARSNEASGIDELFAEIQIARRLCMSTPPLQP